MVRLYKIRTSKRKDDEDKPPIQHQKLHFLRRVHLLSVLADLILLSNQNDKNDFRFRKNDKGLSGKPDIVLSKYSTVIFIHGCFWHGHGICNYSHIPKTLTDYWMSKISNDISRGVYKIELQSFIYGYVNCQGMLEGEVSHSGIHGSCPHSIKVCALKKIISRRCSTN